MAVVTIFSATHCGADEVASAVAESLGLERIETKLLEETSRRFEVPKDKLVRTMTGPAPFWNNFTREREKNVARLRAVLSDLVAEDKKLLHGYAALLIRRAFSHLLRVCLVANFPYRTARAAEALGKPGDAAADIVRKDDKERLQWSEHVFEKTPYDESLYDLVVPMHDKSVEDAARLIRETAESRAVRTTDVSRVEVRDYQLSARVGLKLAEANHDVDVTSRHGAVTILLKHQVLRLEQYKRELKRLARTVEGVSDVVVQPGPKYHSPGISLMANVDLPKILLVDDEKEFVETISERLKTRNLESTVVYDGEEALERVKTDEPDVVVLDLQMPGIGGIETLRRLKRTHPMIEIIILTGHGSEKEEALAAEYGAFAYLQKPVNIEVLAQTMRDAYKKVNESKAADGGDPERA